MKITTKSTIIILSVFIIGLLIGAFSAMSFMRYTVKKRFAEFRTDRGFINEMARLIDLKPEQRDEVEEILQRHAEWGRKFSEEQHEKFIKGMDSLKTELSSVLSTEQIKDLEQKLEMMRDRRPGPGPGGPPPDFNRFDEKRPPRPDEYRDKPPMGDPHTKPPMDSRHDNGPMGEYRDKPSDRR